MKLIIDIPSELYETAKSKSECSYDEYDAMRAIENGTPLDKAKEDWESMLYLTQKATEVLKSVDKIRAEICSHMSIPFEQFNQHDESDYDKGLARALFIIDKHREVSE